MQLTAAEEQSLTQAAQFLDATQDHASLASGQFPDALLYDLMSSDKPDLGMIGCYFASRIDRSVDLSFLEADKPARNYARFLLAEQTPAQILSVPRNPNLRSNVSSLAARIVAPTATVPAPSTSSLTVIVHGTWASTSPWWQQGGNFWTYVNNLVHDVYTGSNPYGWTGANSHGARVAAAQQLVTWVQQNPSSYLRIIAHSHGGNVCFLATRLGLKIHKLVTLGTPIRLEYLPDLRQIDILHNIFSTVDKVQTPAGTIPNRRGEGRTVGDTDKKINHRATDDGSGAQPGHADLHEPATWTASGLDTLL
jgi:hypothetical protein